MSGKRPAAPPAPPAPAARSQQRPAHYSLLLTSAFIGGVVAMVCISCYCCSRGRPRPPRPPPALYTLPPTLCFESRGYLPPYRRPPTPGPPPPYDSVVSTDDKLRRYNIEDDREDIERFKRHGLEDMLSPETLGRILTNCDASTGLEKLRYCTLRGSCPFDGDTERRHLLDTECVRDCIEKSKNKTNEDKRKTEETAYNATNSQEPKLTYGIENEIKEVYVRLDYEGEEVEEAVEGKFRAEGDEVYRSGGEAECCHGPRLRYNSEDNCSSKIGVEEKLVESCEDSEGPNENSEEEEEIKGTAASRDCCKAAPGPGPPRAAPDEALPSYEAAMSLRTREQPCQEAI